MAVALVGWVTYRVLLAAGLMYSGLASVGDPATASLVERYSSLRGRVPAEAVVGYAGPSEPESMHQMLARYTLAPLRLATSDAHDWVLVDLDSDTALAEYVAKANAKVLAHPRPGLAIVERRRGTP